MMEDYRTCLWNSWNDGPAVVMTDIPVSKAQLMGRSIEFDGGRTASWVTTLKNPTWRAVRDAHTGHSIHVLSDRSFEALTYDLRLGLRLLGWMSRTKESIVWYWWDQPWERLLPANTDPGRIHLNGGWAIPGVREVHVYRREEAHKVLLHETIHALLMDVPQERVDPVRIRFETALGRRLWTHFGEAYTELFAEWLWSIASSRSISGAKKKWIYQLACSESQAAAVWERIRDSTEDEDTNVFAYYIMKWVLMQHESDVLLGPKQNVTQWFDWWVEMRPRLESLSAESNSEGRSIRLGMTCFASSFG